MYVIRIGNVAYRGEDSEQMYHAYRAAEKFGNIMRIPVSLSIVAGNIETKIFWSLIEE